MDYELAKQLKDAGFPQKEHELSARDIGEWPRNEAPYLWPYNPTLEELIEACPKEIDAGKDYKRAFSLQYFNGRWHAGYEIFENYEPHTQGSTPVEAVVPLWLELNKKTI